MLREKWYIYCIIVIYFVVKFIVIVVNKSCLINDILFLMNRFSGIIIKMPHTQCCFYHDSPCK